MKSRLSIMNGLLTVLLLSAIVNCSSGIKRHNLVEIGSIYGFVTNKEMETLELVEIEIVGKTTSKIFTNKAGYYSFADLDAGAYHLLFTKMGFEAKNLLVNVGMGENVAINVVLERTQEKGGVLSGTAIDYFSNEPLIVNVTIKELNREALSDTSGHYMFENLEPGQYILKIEASDYVTSSPVVNILPDKTTEIVSRMLKAKSVITLQGVEFEFGSDKIKPGSAQTLDRAAALLTNNPEIEVEIQGHTDNVGPDELNMKLSRKRAEAVRDYLIDIHMIEPVRLIARGYGETKPVASNDTEEDRAKNRRVDFVVQE